MELDTGLSHLLRRRLRAQADLFARIRDALLAVEDEDVRISDESALLKLLDNSNLPNVIAADRGAVARLSVRGSSSMYTFLGGGADVPSVMILIDHLIEWLGATATSDVNGALAEMRAHLALEASTSGLDDLQLFAPAPSHSVSK